MFFARKASKNVRIISTLPFNMFFSDDSQVSLGVRIQTCLLSLTSEGKSFCLILCIIMNWGFKLFSSVSYISSRILHGDSNFKTDQRRTTPSEELRWCLHKLGLLLSLLLFTWTRVRFWPKSTSEHYQNLILLKTHLKTITVLKEWLMFYNY